MYCGACEDVCTKCGEHNNSDNRITNKYMVGFEHMDRTERAEQERIVLDYQINYIKYNVDKKKFPLVTSLPPETVIKLVNKIGDEHPKMLIKKLLTILEKDLSKR